MADTPELNSLFSTFIPLESIPVHELQIEYVSQIRPEGSLGVYSSRGLDEELGRQIHKIQILEEGKVDFPAENEIIVESLLFSEDVNKQSPFFYYFFGIHKLCATYCTNSADIIRSTLEHEEAHYFQEVFYASNSTLQAALNLVGRSIDYKKERGDDLIEEEDKRLLASFYTGLVCSLEQHSYFNRANPNLLMFVFRNLTAQLSHVTTQGEGYLEGFYNWLRHGIPFEVRSENFRIDNGSTLYALALLLRRPHIYYDITSGRLNLDVIKKEVHQSCQMLLQDHSRFVKELGEDDEFRHCLNAQISYETEMLRTVVEKYR